MIRPAFCGTDLLDLAAGGCHDRCNISLFRIKSESEQPMKTMYQILPRSALLAGLICAASVSAQDYIVNEFNSASEASQWRSFWGGAAQTYEFDATKDVNADPNSGSLKVTIQWDLAAHGGDNQFSALTDLPSPINGLSYTNLQMDVFFSPDSPQRPWGDLGRLEYGIRHSDYSQDYFGFIDVPLTPGWIHLVATIPVGNAGIDDIAGVTFKMWSGDATWGQTGTMIIWVDNVKFTVYVPPPPEEYYIVNEFNEASEATEWRRFWGAAPQTYEFDPTADVNEDPNSGALKVTIQFDYAAYGTDNQFSALKDLPSPINGLSYTNLQMDVFFSQDSPQTPSGNLGRLEVGIRHTDWSQDYFFAMDVPLTNGWIHIVAPIPIAHEGIDDIAGITFKMWSGNAASAQTGTMIIWVDNVKLLAKVSTTVPSPVLSLEKATSGLHLFASQPGGEYQRQGMRTVGNNFSWVPHAFDPVTYYIGIKQFPDKAHSGFQTHLFLVPEAGMASGPDDTFIDWNAAHAVFFQIANDTNGTGTGRFMYKTNQPSGNSMFWNDNPANGPVGTLAFLESPRPEGVWSVTFDNTTTSITITEPTGTSTNFAMMPAEAAALFNDPLYAYFGIQPNGTNNVGQYAVLDFVSTRSPDGSFPFVEDPFPGPELDPALWTVVAADSSGVVIIPPEAVYWLNWTLPDAGFGLQSSQIMDPGSWADLTPTIIRRVGEGKKALITTGLLPSPATGFFRMVKPEGGTQ
jgi:hypothetical protein